MGRKSRRKGKVGEREVVKLLTDMMPEWSSIRRGWQSRAGDDECDVEGTPFWIEVKRHRKVTPGAVARAIAQAAEATDGRPVLVFFRSDREKWSMAFPSAEGYTVVEWQYIRDCLLQLLYIQARKHEHPSDT